MAASAAAKRADRGAGSRSERGQAALAIKRVAAQQDENIEELIGLLDNADGRVENEIALAALADTRGRDKAVAVLSRLSERGVSKKSGKGIARALQALSRDRDEEIEAETEALTSDDVSDQSKSTVGEAVEQNVEGQATAGTKLAELIASDRTPEAAKAGLQRAYDAVTGEQKNSAQALERACERMPEAICTFVRGVVTGARANAQEMRNDHPSGPPSARRAASHRAPRAASRRAPRFCSATSQPNDKGPRRLRRGPAMCLHAGEHCLTAAALGAVPAIPRTRAPPAFLGAGRRARSPPAPGRRRSRPRRPSPATARAP